MDTKLLSKKFEQMGARVQVSHFKPGRFDSERDRIDIKMDRQGEYFDIRIAEVDQVDYEDPS